MVDRVRRTANVIIDLDEVELLMGIVNDRNMVEGRKLRNLSERLHAALKGEL